MILNSLLIFSYPHSYTVTLLSSSLKTGTDSWTRFPTLFNSISLFTKVFLSTSYKETISSSKTFLLAINSLVSAFLSAYFKIFICNKYKKRFIYKKYLISKIFYPLLYYIFIFLYFYILYIKKN